MIASLALTNRDENCLDASVVSQSDWLEMVESIGSFDMMISLRTIWHKHSFNHMLSVTSRPNNLPSVKWSASSSVVSGTQAWAHQQSILILGSFGSELTLLHNPTVRVDLHKYSSTRMSALRACWALPTDATDKRPSFTEGRVTKAIFRERFTSWPYCQGIRKVGETCLRVLFLSKPSLSSCRFQLSAVPRRNLPSVTERCRRPRNLRPTQGRSTMMTADFCANSNSSSHGVRSKVFVVIRHRSLAKLHEAKSPSIHKSNVEACSKVAHKHQFPIRSGEIVKLANVKSTTFIVLPFQVNWWVRSWGYGFLGIYTQIIIRGSFIKRFLCRYGPDIGSFVRP